MRTTALVVRSVAVGEADSMILFFTEALGIASAIARSARRSSKRFSALEPMHLLRVGLDVRSGAEVATLAEASIERTRLRLVADLDRLEAAGHALRWVRKMAPPSTPEPELWIAINDALDALDAEGPVDPGSLLASVGFQMLAAVGWGLDLERCVRCGKPCKQGASAYLDPRRGGLVCTACGGASLLLRGERRERFAAAARGEPVELSKLDAASAIDIVEAALDAHAGV